MSTLDSRSARRRPRRTTVPVALVWAIAGGMVLVIAADTSVGPVLWTFGRSHGVHLGDVVALCGATTAAGAATRFLVRR